MNDLSIQIFRHKKYAALAAALFSLIIGAAASFQPANSFVLLAVLTAAAGLLSKPAGIPVILLLLSAITFDFVFNFTIAGFDAATIYKLSIILVMALAMKMYGASFQYSAPLIVLSLILIATYTVADFHPRLGSLTPFISYFGMGAPFLILLVKWDKKIADSFILSITLLPLVSILAGFVLQSMGIRPVFFQEYLGANRLQGANIAAHLAMLSFVGFCASIMEVKRRGDRKVLFLSLIAVNFIIMFSTGTRGALISSILILTIFLFDYIKDFVKGRIIAIIPLVLLLVTVIAVLITQWENILRRSFNEHSSDIGINLSGRDLAWRFFLSESRNSEIFGQGLGSSLIANDGSLYRGFTVPHNEYIRFFFDAGIFGLVLFFGALLYVLVKVGLQMPKQMMVYYFSFIVCFLMYSFVDNTLTTIHFIVPFLFLVSSLNSLYEKEKT